MDLMLVQYKYSTWLAARPRHGKSGEYHNCTNIESLYEHCIGEHRTHREHSQSHRNVQILPRGSSIRAYEHAEAIPSESLMGPLRHAADSRDCSEPQSKNRHDTTVEL